ELQQADRRESALDRRRAGLANVPGGVLHRAGGLAGESPAQAGIDRPDHRLAVEAQRTPDARVGDAGPQQVAGRAPGRADHRAAPREYTDGGAEHREAVDEVAGAVDRIDGPDHVMIAARAIENFLAQDVVGRELDRQPGADQGLDALVDLRDR